VIARKFADPTPLKRIVLLLALGLATEGTSANAALATASATNNPASAGKHKPHTHADQLSSQPLASQAGGEAVREAAALPSARLRERTGLLKSGEAALARGDVTGALDAFERAALILHAADTEIALVRSYMQAGDYRRALGFGAHTAGAHLDVTGGSLLYAWLLHVGGQPAVAQRLLADGGAQLPGNPALQAVRQQLRSGAPVATGPLLELPTRLAPYGDMKGLPSTARMVGSAVLLPGGATALVPLSLLPRSGRLWLRNGLGQLVKATSSRRLAAAGVALMRLERPLPAVKDLAMAASDAFPGSAGFAVEYVVSLPNAEPAWPILRTGFLGSFKGDSDDRLLGIDMPAGPRGGPVFDGAGRLIGLALPEGAGKSGDRLVPVSQLKKSFGSVLGVGQPPAQKPATPASSMARGPVDKIYEDSLKTSLQVITAP
jgi:hypothetical protein